MRFAYRHTHIHSLPHTYLIIVWYLSKTWYEVKGRLSMDSFIVMTFNGYVNSIYIYKLCKPCVTHNKLNSQDLLGIYRVNKNSRTIKTTDRESERMDEKGEVSINTWICSVILNYSIIFHYCGVFNFVSCH